MLKYNKAVEFLQFRFADAMNSIDPRFNVDAIEALMARDQIMPHVDKFLIGSHKTPVLFLLVSDLLWSSPDQNAEEGTLDTAGNPPVGSHLENVMFTPRVTNASGVAAIIYALRVPNPASSSAVAMGMEASPSKGFVQEGQGSALIDVTSEVLFGVLQNNPVEEFIQLSRDVLIPLGLQCHQLILTESRGSSSEAHPSESASPMEHTEPLFKGSLRGLNGYASERAREKTINEVEAFYRNAQTAVDNVERLEREKQLLIGFQLNDPTRVLRKVQATPAGLERAAKDPAVASFTTSLFADWINYARDKGTRDAVCGYYPVVVSAHEGGAGSVRRPSPPPPHTATNTPAQTSLLFATAQSDSHRYSSSTMAAPDPELNLGEGEGLIPLNPPRQYDFQRLPESYGPMAEISQWKAFELHVSHLCDTADTRDVAALETILAKSNPKLFDVWTLTVAFLRSSRDEATKVVKYLNSVSRHFEPLYGSDPAAVALTVKDIVQTLEVIHVVVPHYGSKDHFQQLIQAVAHQVIACCKQSIRSLGRVWEQSENSTQLKRLLKKFSDSVAMCRAFQDHLSETKVFSMLDELCVFGKLELFCSRLQKLTNLFSIVLVFRTLEEYHMEGISGILQAFFGTFEDLRRKSGDSLEYTKPSFDKDYLDFVNKVADVDCSLQVYVNSCFEDVPNTVAALELLRKFSLLVKRPSLRADLQAKYFLLFQRFGTELELVQRIYEQHKADPPIPRNATPVAGRILWARQLHHRIEAPMKIFLESQSMVSHQRDTAKIIRLYNRVALAITEYEQYWLQTWKKAVEVADDGLKATVLIHDRHSGYVVNFDTNVALMAREARWLMTLGIEAPAPALGLLRLDAGSKSIALQHLIRWLNEAESSIKPLHEQALAVHVDNVHAQLRPATETITWNSAYLGTFLDRVAASIGALAALVQRVNSTEENLISEPISRVQESVVTLQETSGFSDAQDVDDAAMVQAAPSETASLAIGDGASLGLHAKPVTLEHLVEQWKNATSAMRDSLSTSNKVVRDAVIDLCRLMDASWSPEEQHDRGEYSSHAQSHQLLTNLYIKYNRRLFTAVLHSTLESLSHLRTFVQGIEGLRQEEPIGATIKSLARSKKLQAVPLIRLEVVLMPPSLFVSPSLEELQTCFQLMMRMVLDTTHATGNWPNVRGAYSTFSSAPFYDEVHRNKEAVKRILLVSSTVLQARKQVDDVLRSFEVFRAVWSQNPSEVVKTFAEAPNRTVDHYAEELRFCTKLLSQVQLIPDIIEVACFSLDCKQLKVALNGYLQKWGERYGSALYSQLDGQLSALLDKTDIILKRVAHEAIMDISHIDGELQGLDAASAAEVEVDRELYAIRNGWVLLEDFHVTNVGELQDRASDINIKWKKIGSLSSKKREAIGGIQLSLRHELHEAVKRFGVEILCFRNDFEQNGPLVESIKPDEAMEKLRRFQRVLEDKLRVWQVHFHAELRFGAEPHRYPELAKTVRDMHTAEQLYSLYSTVLSRLNALGKMLWRNVKYDEIVNELLQFQQNVKRLPVTVKGYEAYDTMKALLEKRLELQPVIEQLAHRSVRERHWQQVMKICGSSWSIDKDTFILDSVWSANLMPFKDDIMELAMASEKEGELENKLHSVIREWKDKEFTFAEYKHRGLILLKGDDTATLKESLEETLVILGSMLASKYVAPFRHEAAGWSSRLAGAGDTIALWLEVQSMWQYLEAVFSSGDIARQLPHDAKRFSMVDRQWVKLFFRAVESPNALEFSVSNEIKNLPYLKDQLELCQRALAQYLESKRNAFSRFYFVSDAVLLEVLAQGSDPTAMQPHFNTIFDGIHSVQLEPSVDKKAWKVKALVSAEDEVVQLSEVVSCEGSIEEWLNRLATEMCRSVRVVLREAVGDALSIRTDVSLLRRFYMSHFSQAVLTALQVLFTTTVSEVLSGPQSERRDMAKRLTENKDILAEMARGQLSAAARTHIQTLTTMAVHNLEVWEDHAKKAKDVMSFEWQRQLRFYWTDRNECVLRIADADIMYCNEYLGVKERLVVTPLTDRCYITLSQALAMYMGGAPAGPAGTGKTETVKDLGRAAGKYVVVFNCSDQFDARATAKIFRGLCQSGCWGCLDEFNRITLPVLSVVSQQVHVTFAALKQHVNEFVFADGLPCRLVDTVGVFVTMNPTYAGRQELPENLKVHFRGVSMMIPDRLCIMKTKLAAAGYKMDKPLSQKFFLLYSLCEQQLSKQQHYDFGLRNILSVLRTAGDVLRQSSGADEEGAFMRCVRDMNVSKFVHEDVPVFLSLLNDIFAGKAADRLVIPALEGALRDAAAEGGLTVTDSWMRKCFELYETKLVRHGVMIVGPAGGGKTSCMRALLRALHQTEGRHKEVRLNPKALTVQQLFGYLDATSGDWYDGVFSYLWRRWNKERGVSVWLVCDGPVDTLWIESLNTVLDDNKVLTLANGDRVMMSPTLRMCFEVESLQNASPATVSRAGVIYISLEDIGWQAVLRSLIDKLIDAKKWPSSIKDRMYDLLSVQAQSVFWFTAKTLHSFSGLSLQHMLFTVMDLASVLIQRTWERYGDSDTARFWITAKMCVGYAIAWGVGGTLDEADRDLLSNSMLQAPNSLPIGGGYQAPPKLAAFQRVAATAAAASSSSASSDTSGDIVQRNVIFEYFVDVDTTTWVSWKTQVPAWRVRWDVNAPSVNATNLFVPHTASVIQHQLMHIHNDASRPVLLLGRPGSSKTVVMQEFLRSASGDDLVWAKKNISRATTPLLFQRAFEDMCEKRMGSMYGPQRNRRLNLLIDDLSMADRNEWGDQPTCELLRQLMESGGFYNVDRIGDFKRFVDIKFCAAATTEDIPRNVGGASYSSSNGVSKYISPRLARHFAVYHCSVPQQESLVHIFNSILTSRFESTHLLHVCPAVVKATVQLFRLCHEKLLPSPTRLHYSFNMRDMSRVFQGVLGCSVRHLESALRLITLWNHEVQRVFGDKLCHEDDVAWFQQRLQQSTADILQAYGGGTSQWNASTYFANFISEKILDSTTGEMMEPPREYRLTTLDVIQKKVQSRIDEINETRGARTAAIEVVLFEAALQHICRLCRIISAPRGSAMCIGLGGSGRQTTARLAAQLQQQPLFQPAVTSEYQILNWLEDLRGQYIHAASQGPCVMLITDNELKSEDFLEYINASLSSGDVPGLFSADEKETARNLIRPIARKTHRREFEDSEEWLWNYFIQRVQENLHFVVCLSPIGERFQRRVRQFPAILAACTIDYFFPWGRDALLQVTNVELERSGFLAHLSALPHVAAKLPQALAGVEAIAKELSESYFTLHRLSIGVTPAMYLNFLRTFVVVYRRKERHLCDEAKNLRIGLQKLNQAGRDVVAMRKELNTKEIALAKSTIELESLLELVNEKAASANVKKERVQVATDKIADEAAAVAATREEAENDLVAAQPALEAAKAALEQITPTDIITLRAMRRPPEMVRRIFDGVCVLLHAPLDDVKVAVSNSGRARIEDSWNSSGRIVCSRPELLDTLLQFNVTGKDRLNDETCELLYPYLWQDDFTYERAKVASGNIAGLCTWVRAMEVYRRVAKFVAPKIDALHTAEVLLRIADGKLQLQKAELAVAEQEVAECEALVDSVRRDKDILEADTMKTKRRLAYASELIEALADEKRRWEEQENSFNATMERLTGDVISAAVMVAFAGPYNSEFRQRWLSRVSANVTASHVPHSGTQFQFQRFMVTEEEVARWASEGLPMDNQSIENAIIARESLLVPAFVDPQNQAHKWLRQHLEQQRAVFTTTSNRSFMQILERQMEKGHPLVLEEVEFTCDPLLNALLAMRPVRPVTSNNAFGGSLNLASSLNSPSKAAGVSPLSSTTPFMSMIQMQRAQGGGPEHVGILLGASYPCNAAFKLYVLPSKSQVDFEPEVFSRVCVIDASVTMIGLEQQLLARLISLERQELEHQRTAVLEQIRCNEGSLRTLEEELLLKLSQSRGNLVDDETLILTLQHSKTSAQLVKEQLATASTTSKRIQEARQEYSPVSQRGAMLYFVSTELARVMPAYELSLERMISLFEQGVQSSLPSNQVAQRIQNIVSTTTQLFFSFVGRGLFERHKSMFSLSLALHVHLQAGHVKEHEVKLLLAGGTALDTEELLKTYPKPFAWFPISAWKHAVALSNHHAFSTLLEAISKQETMFRTWMETESPENDMVPYYTKLSSLERLLIVRCLREDRTLHASSLFVKDVLGASYVEVPAFSLEWIVNNEATVPRTPVVFLLTPGSDPTAYIDTVAKKKKANLTQLSLGQGQEAVAIQALHKCALNGDWVMFQNCHLGISFLQYLDRWAYALLKAREVPLDTPPAESLASPKSPRSRAAREYSSSYSPRLGAGGGIAQLVGRLGSDTAVAVDPMTVPDHPDFRLFLTSEPTNDFPNRLLLRSLPLTNEPPTGTRATMKKVLNWVQQDTWDLFPSPLWRACIQALCFYHSVLLERRKHGIYGWTTPYQFTEGDFTASLFFLQNLFGSMTDDMRRNAMSWEAVQFMIGDIHYGGRVTIRNDRLTLQAVTEGIFCNNLSLGSKAMLSPTLQRFPVLGDIGDVTVWRSKVLEQFQNSEPPAFAGLGANAEVVHRTKVSQAVLATLLSIQPRHMDAAIAVEGTNKKSALLSQEDIALSVAQQTLKRLPIAWSDVQLSELVEARDRLKPLTILFNLEAQRLRTVIQKADQVLRQVSLAIAGSTPLTPELSDAVSALSLGIVPTALKQLSWSAQSFTSWFSMLVRRYEQISEYLNKGERLVYDIACFFNAQGFLNSVRQQICRQRGAASGWVLGRVETKLTITKLAVSDVERAAEEGAFVTGFYLDGAGWDTAKGRLRPPQPKELYRELPVILVSAQMVVSAPSSAKPTEKEKSSGRKTTPRSPTAAVESSNEQLQELAAYGNMTQAAFRAHRALRESDSVVRKTRIPCFTSPSRGDDNMLCVVELAHEEADAAAWTLRGVAMLTAIE